MHIYVVRITDCSRTTNHIHAAAQTLRGYTHSNSFSSSSALIVVLVLPHISSPLRDSGEGFSSCQYCLEHGTGCQRCHSKFPFGRSNENNQAGRTEPTSSNKHCCVSSCAANGIARLLLIKGFLSPCLTIN